MFPAYLIIFRSSFSSSEYRIEIFLRVRPVIASNMELSKMSNIVATYDTLNNVSFVYCNAFDITRNWIVTFQT